MDVQLILADVEVGGMRYLRVAMAHDDGANGRVTHGVSTSGSCDRWVSIRHISDAPGQWAT